MNYFVSLKILRLEKPIFVTNLHKNNLVFHSMGSCASYFHCLESFELDNILRQDNAQKITSPLNWLIIEMVAACLLNYSTNSLTGFE